MIQVKVFDHEHEKDLEVDMNAFLRKLEDKQFIDVKYSVALVEDETDELEQVYCFSAMVIYRA